MAHHDHRSPQMGAWVMINAGWYKLWKNRQKWSSGLLRFQSRFHAQRHDTSGRSLLSSLPHPIGHSVDRWSIGSVALAKTDSLQTALRRLPLVAAALESEFERLRNDAGLSVDRTLLRPCEDDLASTLSRQKTEQPETEVRAMVTLGEAYTRYIDDPAHCWSASTRQAYETTRKIALSALGADIAINSLVRAHCRDYLQMRRHLPRNAAKRFPKLTLREAFERAREQGDIELISAANANVYLANFSSFLNWAVNKALLARNPMRGLRLRDDVATRHTGSDTRKWSSDLTASYSFYRCAPACDACRMPAA